MLKDRTTSAFIIRHSAVHPSILPHSHTSIPIKATIAYLGLGTNLGDRLTALRAAVRQLDESEEIQVRRVSPVYESEAHTLRPGERQPAYLNAVVEVATTLAPEALLAFCHGLEQAAGRERRQRWAARTLDIDVLLFGQRSVQQEGLTIPHPRMGERRFVLQPLADLAPNLHVPPPFDTRVTDLLARCPDTTTLERLDATLGPFRAAEE